MHENQIAITGIGMISPLGLNAAQTCASVRSGINRFLEYEDYYCEPEELDWGDPEPLTGSRVPHPELDSEMNRILSFTLSSIQDLIQNAKISRADFSRTRVNIALPYPDRAGADKGVESGMRNFFEKNLKPDVGELRLFMNGQTAFFNALEDAAATLDKGDDTLCIVAGADSYHGPDVLSLLDTGGRLRSNRNRDGFIPGEAAAALLVESKKRALERNAGIFAVIKGIGSGTERNALNSDMPSSGEGLVKAVETAMQSAGNESELEWVACDLNGESYRAREWGLCQVRMHKYFSRLKHVWHPADCLGDVGAASGAVFVSLVAKAMEKGYAPADTCLAWLSSDDQYRAALVVQGN